MLVQHVEGGAALGSSVQFDRMVEGTNRLRIYRPRLQTAQFVSMNLRLPKRRPGDGGRETYGGEEVEKVYTREPGHDLQENVTTEGLQRHRHLVADG